MKMYLLALVWLAVLIGSSVSSSFQHISASSEREACVTALLQIQGNLTMMISNGLDTLSDAVICLSLSESDTTVRGTCVTDLVRAKVVPEIEVVYYFDTLAKAAICLAQSEADTIVRGACVTDLVTNKCKS